MKRVGILTLYYKTYNFGAQLQAYALQRNIEKMGYDCELIRYKWCREETIEGYDHASVNQDRFIDFSNSIKHSKRVYSTIDISDCVDDYDYFVVGSDQVWGVENSMPLVNLSIMLLEFVPANKIRVAYSASMGGGAASSRIEELLKSGLRNFDALSVREKSAAEYLKKISGFAADVVMDPVFLSDSSEWEVFSQGSVVAETEPYLLYYTAGADYRQEMILKKLEKNLGIKIKRLGYITGEKIGPQDFVALVKNAKYVLTDSFHATVFSIVFQKNIVVLPVDQVPTDRSKNTRLCDLLQIIGLRNRFFTNLDDCDSAAETILNLFLQSIDYRETSAKVKELREHSFNFLRKSLTEKKSIEVSLPEMRFCSGCGACSLVCPVEAIQMRPDELGFLYPHIDNTKCIKCGKCVETCKEAHNFHMTDDLECFMGVESRTETIRRKSSAGGVFYEIACGVIENDGIIVACRYDEDFNVVHDFCRTVQDLDKFCRSKYVQSNAFEIFPKIKSILAEGKELLFVGTPCQTASLVAFLKSVPENLYLIDLVCGGVGAPGLWKKYLDFKMDNGPIDNISMRYKYTEYLRPEGYPAFSMEIKRKGDSSVYEGTEDLFLKSRMSFYRDNCYKCAFKGDDRVSDITLGDFVGMNELFKNEYDGCGTTLTCIHTKKGEKLLKNCGDKVRCFVIPDEMKDLVVQKNPMYSNNMKRKFQHFFLRSIFAESSIERLFYEDKYWDEFSAREFLLRSLYNERKRNELCEKTQKYIEYGLMVDDDPNVNGDVFIYGAGKLGKQLSRCGESIKGFFDGNLTIKMCEGLRVYDPYSAEAKSIVKSGYGITVIVTPIWDFSDIKDRLIREYPDINVLSAQEVVGDIWI